jgi:predicted esterase
MRGLVLLHGRGGSARDMATLLGPLGAEGLAVAAPEAPGNSWWPTSFLAPAAAMEGPLAAALAAVDGALDELGLPRGEVALVGFSQGACLALEYAARRGAGLGGVVALSGGLIGTSDAPGEVYGHGEKAFDYDTDLTGTRVLITCHERDPHIPLSRSERSAEVLGALGADVRFLRHPGAGHQPMPEGVAAARALIG